VPSSGIGTGSSSVYRFRRIGFVVGRRGWCSKCNPRNRNFISQVYGTQYGRRIKGGAKLQTLKPNQQWKTYPYIKRKKLGGCRKADKGRAVVPDVPCRGPRLFDDERIGFFFAVGGLNMVDNTRVCRLLNKTTNDNKTQKKSGENRKPTYKKRKH